MRLIATGFPRSRTALLLSRQNRPTTEQKPGGFQSWSSFNESLSSLLKKSPSHPHLQEARRLHALMLVGGILKPDSDIAAQASSLLGSRLVRVYAQLGCLKEALLAFGRLHCVHNVACNAILRAYVDSANFLQAIHFFNHLVFKLGFIPDNYTCPLILKACSELCALEEGRKIHDLIRFVELFFQPAVDWEPGKREWLCTAVL
ncbi:Pentatricopeptide repeat-containing protein [Sesamum alatum]|uniref:Pentatricopeptide repeat-containing protein n=1 Tax=Sesamum alatum TaxID=300844 RepID=A0AAE2CDF3_9LAMI|nr:Pentatricopeptide repeat-containing protein [Sesamum alatum]